jgi:16S rRNA processing protein RimM
VKSIEKKDFIRVGKVVSCHGNKGELRCASNFALKEKEWVFIEVSDKPVPFFIEHILGTHDEPILKLKTINSVNQAHPFIGKSVLIPKKLLPKKREEISHDHLIDFVIRDTTSGFSGKIKSIEETLAHPLFVVSDKKRELLIPFVEEWIEDINFDDETITVKLPEGLIS